MALSALRCVVVSSAKNKYKAICDAASFTPLGGKVQRSLLGGYKPMQMTFPAPLFVGLRHHSSGTHPHTNVAPKAQHRHQSVTKSSESESDSDLEVLGHRGESDFWRRKIRTFHGILDVNNDGVISYDDFKLLAQQFIQLGHLSEKHQAEFVACMKDLWEKRWGEISPYNLVTVEQFLEDMHHILNDKRMVRRAHSFLPYLFKAVDKDKSGEIRVDEFKLFFECLGLQEQDAILAFRAIDSNGDGKVTLKEFVKHGRDFFLTEDEERISKYFWGPLVEH